MMSDKKDKYPFLDCWKRQGKGSFPAVPVGPVLKEKREKTIAGLKGSHTTPETKLLFGPHPPPAPLDEASKEEYRRYFDEKLAQPMILKAGYEWYFHECLRFGAIVIKHRNRLFAGEDREMVLRDLGRKVFPNTKGGPAFLEEYQKSILKSIYIELKDLIKEIRTNLGVTSKTGEYLDDDLNRAKDNLDILPQELRGLFYPDELEKLLDKRSISQTALEIIVRRLRPCLKNEIPSRTLANLLNSSPPIIFSDP